MGAFGKQLRSQLYVAFLNKIRRWGSLLFELGIPILLMFALAGIKTTADIDERPYTTYNWNASLLPSIEQLLSFPTPESIASLDSNSTGWYIANLGGFVNHGASNIAWVCEISEAQNAILDGDQPPSLEDICAPQQFVVIPEDASDSGAQDAADAFKEWWTTREALLEAQDRFNLGGQTINDNAELNAYVAASDYGQPSRPRIGLAIVFESGAPDYRYQIRVNATASYSDGPPKLNIPRVGPTQRNTSDLDRGTTDFTSQYIFSGFASTQQSIDTWILQNATNADTAELRISSFAMPTEAFKEDTFWTSLGTTFALFLIIALLFPIAKVIQQLTADKETRIRELMEVMGLSTGAYFCSWIIFYVGFFTLLAGVLTGIAYINVFVYSDPSVIFVYLLLYLTSSVAYAFFISSLFHRANLATVVGLLVYFLGYLIFTPLAEEDSPLGAQIIVSLIPSAAFSFGTIPLAQYEGGLIGLNWSNVSQGNSGFTMALCFGMLMFDTVLFFLLAIYLDAVLKSPLGASRKRWHFPCTWCCRRRRKSRHRSRGARGEDLEDDASDEYKSFIKQLEAEEVEAVAASNGTVQPVNAQLASLRARGKAIAIGSLEKTYKTAKGPVHAVNDLSLSFFEGQITALLGHNGAGKSTVSNILGGLIPATSGQAFVGGLSVSQDMLAIRDSLGVCPQQNVLYPNLTVAEHLRVFSGIKGMPQGPETEAAIAKVIADVGLSPKTNTVSKALSGGMKRKLQLAMALIGDNKVLILDEPTSGMDPFARQFVQQTLARYRDGRTVILSTHYMDEADLLGDRIAIVSKGRLQAVGTSLFLKKRFGVGYQIACECSVPPEKRQLLIECIIGHVPDAKVTSNVGAELALDLPLTASAAFADLLQELDERKAELGVVDTGISVSTLESCFLRVADGDVDGDAKDFARTASKAAAPGSFPGDADSNLHLKSINAGSDQGDAHLVLENGAGALSPAAPPDAPESGSDRSAPDNDIHNSEAQVRVSSTSRHTRALLLKRFRYAKRDKGAFCCQICIPVIFLILGFVFMAISVRTTVQPLWFDAQYDDWNQDGTPNPVPFNLGSGKTAPNTTTVDLMEDFFQLNRVSLSEQFNVGPSDTYCADERYLAALVKETLPLLRLVLPPDVLDPGFDLSELAKNPQVLLFLLPGIELCTPSTSTYPNSTAAFSANLEETRSTSPGSRYGAALYNVLPDISQLEYSVVYNFTGVHSLPLMMNRINAALLGNSVNDKSFTISAASNPLPRTEAEDNIGAGFTAFSAALALGIAFSFVPAGFAVFVVREKQNKSLEQQLINGVSPLAYWSSSYFFDIATYVVPMLTALILVFAFENSRDAFVDNGNIGPVLLIFILYGLAVTFFTYSWTFAFTTYRGAQLGMIGINLLGGVILLMVAFIMSVLENTYQVNAVLVYFYRLIPTFCFSHGLLQIAQVRFLGFVLNSVQRGGDPSNPREYTVWDWEIAGADILFLAIEIVVYGILLVYLQRRFPAGTCECSATKRVLCCGRRKLHDPKAEVDLGDTPVASQDTADFAGQDFSALEDSDVIQERERVNAASKSLAEIDIEAKGGPQEKDALVLKQVRKVYRAIGAKARAKVAVADMSLGIHKRECFALLGVNGAGKSTTMAMAAGSLPPTVGSVLINSLDLNKERDQALGSLGFCPQYDAIFDLLTGREHIELYGAIKGIPQDKLKPLVDATLHHLTLDDFADRMAGGYSGGNKRKLSLACAIIGDPSVLLVDEVAAGVDVAARRKLWEVISDLSKTSSIVLTTHSMEEAEALCSRIGIMVDGRLKCLGTAQHLKSRYGTGYQLEVTLKMPNDDQIAKSCDTIGQESSATLDAEGVRAALSTLGQADLYGTCFSVTGSAAILHQQLELGTGTITARSLADWSLAEMAYQRFSNFLTKESGLEGVQLIERQSLRLRFSIPFQAELKLHEIFRMFEAQRDLVEDFALGQTTLETIFNNFSATQSQSDD